MKKDLKKVRAAVGTYSTVIFLSYAYVTVITKPYLQSLISFATSHTHEIPKFSWLHRVYPLSTSFMSRPLLSWNQIQCVTESFSDLYKYNKFSWVQRKWSHGISSMFYIQSLENHEHCDRICSNYRSRHSHHTYIYPWFWQWKCWRWVFYEYLSSIPLDCVLCYQHCLRLRVYLRRYIGKAKHVKKSWKQETLNSFYFLQNDPKYMSYYSIILLTNIVFLVIQWEVHWFVIVAFEFYFYLCSVALRRQCQKLTSNDPETPPPTYDSCDNNTKIPFADSTQSNAQINSEANPQIVAELQGDIQAQLDP